MNYGFPIFRIGEGSLGGKALNLAAVSPVLSEQFARSASDRIPVVIPP